MRQAPGREKTGPLSAAQRRFWFLDRLHPNTPLYNVCSAIRLTGPLDPRVAAQGVQAIVRRHDVLRTSFPSVDGVPGLRVAPALRVATPLIDLTGLEPDVLAVEGRRLAREHARRGFDLERGPVLRTALVREGHDRHTLLLNVHHIASDAWSTQLFVDEFLEIITALAEHRAPALEPLPAQYADAAARDEAQRHGETYEADLRYWREHLAGLVGAPGPPPDHSSPDGQELAADSLRLRLDGTLRARVRELARAERVTPFMVLLTAFKITLSRYLDRDDIAVGTPIALRDDPDTHRLIGPFLNILALRTDLSGDLTARQALHRVRDTCLGAYEHQAVAFEDLVAALATRRDASGDSFLGVAFQYVSAPAQRTGPGGITARAEEVEPGLAKFDLTVDVVRTHEGLEVLAQYKSGRYEAETIDGLLRHWQAVLHDMTTCVEMPVHLTGAAAPEDLAALLGAARGRHIAAPTESSFLDVVEDWAARTPHATALVDANTRLTYAELDQVANRLAHRLRAAGVSPEERVGIYTERSAETVVAVLAAWKAGAVHVPLDLDSPGPRRGMILADAGVRVVMTQAWLAPDLDDVHVLVVNAETDDTGPQGRPARRTDPDSLAYVMYTSGSTGRPKGVMATHGAVLRIQRAWEHAFRLRGRITAHLQMANFSFDGFIGELVRGLGSGASLVICPRETLLLPARLLSLMRHEGVDAADFVPTVLRTLTSHVAATGQNLGFLKLLIVGSDTFPADELAHIRGLCGPDTDVVNCYGLTEGTVDSTFFTVSDRERDTHAVLIGTPLAGTEAYILDSRMRPVPPGVPGILYIAGPTLTRGYLGDPGRTADAYVPHPWGEDGQRMYRTGDRARHRRTPRGLQIEFLGRRDQQLKVRGYRVELGEIEAAFRRTPNVRDAVLVATGDERARRLHAYVVPRAHDTTTDWHGVLRASLPVYMMPHRLVLLPALPLTANGKLDRAALAVTAGEEVAPPGAREPARTPVERSLLALWQQVLGHSDIGVHDDFFTHGGDSLLVMRCIAMAYDTWGVDLTVRAFFGAPTVARLAPLVERLSGEGTGLPGAGSDRIVPVARELMDYEEDI